jgi:cytochrome c oxidase cbb3-type subunit 3
MTLPARSGLGALLVLAVLVTGCDWQLPGKPIRPEPETIDSRSDFNVLYFDNCLGCHGPEGRQGPARPLNDPLYLAVVPTVTLERVIRIGHGPLMPGFRKTLAGGLDELQIAALASGMKHFWGDDSLKSAELPDYAVPPGRGDVKAGKVAFTTFCGGCHGEDGGGLEGHAGSVIDNDYLLLVSDQALRSTVLFGRTDLATAAMPTGCPDFRGPYPGQPADRSLTASEIDDVSAWLSANRMTYTEEAAR